MKLRCTACGDVADAPADERCRNCLRRALVPYEPDAVRGRLLAPCLGLLLSWALGFPGSWLVFHSRAALGRQLWLGALVLCVALILLPARLVFRRDFASGDARETLRALGWLWAAAVWLAVCVAFGTAGGIGNIAFDLGLALALFFLPLLLVPPVLEARRANRPLLPAFSVGARRWVGLVVAVTVLVIIQAARTPPPRKPIVLPSTGLHEPLAVAEVPTTWRWDGTTLQIRSDTQELNEAVKGLLTHLEAATTQVRAAPNSDGVLVWCLSPRLQSPDFGTQLQRVLTTTNQVLANFKTSRGVPLSLTTRFDCPR